MASSSATFILFFLAFCVTSFRGHKYNENGERVLIRRKRALDITDFMDNIEVQLQVTAKREKAAFLWSDFDGDFIERVENPTKREEFKNFKTKIYSGPTHYSQAATKVRTKQKADVLKVTRCNPDKNQAKTIPIHVPVQKKNKYSWEMKKKFTIKKNTKNGKVDVPIDLKLQPPGFASPDSGMQGGVNLKSNHKGNFTQETVDKQVIDFNVTVNPGTLLQMDISVESEELELPFFSELIMEGYVAARFNATNANNTKFRFYELIKFADMNYVKRGNAIVFNCSGIFRGARGISSFIHTYDEELGDRQCPEQIHV